MKVYIDFDDVICETGVYFTKIAKELFDIDLPYSQFRYEEDHLRPMDRHVSGLMNMCQSSLAVRWLFLTDPGILMKKYLMRDFSGAIVGRRLYAMRSCKNTTPSTR